MHYDTVDILKYGLERPNIVQILVKNGVFRNTYFYALKLFSGSK